MSMEKKAANKSYENIINANSAIGKRLINSHLAVAADRIPGQLSYLHVAFCQVGLPRRKTEDIVFERTNGTTSIRIKAGELWSAKRKQWEQQLLPHGMMARLLMVHVNNEAIKKKDRTIVLGKSVSEYLKINHKASSGRNITTAQEAIKQFAACSMRMGFLKNGISVNVDATPVSSFGEWEGFRQQEGSLNNDKWPCYLELSELFYKTLIQNAVPIDPVAIAGVTHSTLAFDILVWLIHRLPRLTTPVELVWEHIIAQFGRNHGPQKAQKIIYDIKIREVETALHQALLVYPNANVTQHKWGLTLRASPPLVPKRIVTKK